MDWAAHRARVAAQTEMLAALEAGKATPEQQRAAFAHLQEVKRQHRAELRDADRDARDAYHEGRHDGDANARGADYGPGIY